VTLLRDADDIRAALSDLVEQACAEGLRATICIVGGAAVELHVGDRGSTRDIDALVFRVGALDHIVARIASERGWPHNWLNADARLYASDHDDPLQWAEVLRVGEVVVRVAPIEVLIAMKLHAARGARDFLDVDLLLGHLGWQGDDAAACFERHYPYDTLKPAALRYLAARRT